MIKKSKIGIRNLIRVPDTFNDVMAQLGTQDVDVHYGNNFDVLVIVPSGKDLSRDNKERIRILTEVKQ